MKKRQGRPSKIDKESMKVTNTVFLITIIVLLILLSVATVTIINPSLIENIKANIRSLIK